MAKKQQQSVSEPQSQQADTTTLTPHEQQMGDDLEQMLRRESMLLAGGPGGGKSYAVAKLIEQCQQTGRKVVCVDGDNGLAKAVGEVMGKVRPTCLTYFRLDKWSKLKLAVDHAFTTLGPDDWIVFEMAGPMWDAAQTEYARLVYGDDLTNHVLQLRIDAQEAIRQAGLDVKGRDAKATVSKATGFQGMEGRTDWPLIKRMHNDQVFDKVKVEAVFNWLTTTSMTPLNEDDLQKNKYPLWSGIGRRPEGEKHHVHRHDTIAVIERKGEQFLWRTDLGAGKGKDRGGRVLVRDIDCTDTGFIRSYYETHGLEW